LAVTATASDFKSDWHHSCDRVWLGADYWANPMEDWRLSDGKAECLSTGENRNLVLLTRHVPKPGKGFSMSILLDKIEPGRWGSAGFRVGINDKIDDYRVAALRAQGLDCGVTQDGRLFIGAPERRVATRHGLSRNGWEIVHVDSTRIVRVDNMIDRSRVSASAIDGEPSTFWQSRNYRSDYPHEMHLDMGKRVMTTGMGCLPRQDSEIGRFKEYEVYLSNDGETWGNPVADGEFENSADLQRVEWNPREARYLRLVMKSPYKPQIFACIAELYVFGKGERKAPIPAPTADVPAPWLLTLNAEKAAGGKILIELELKRADNGEQIASLQRHVDADSVAGLTGLFQDGYFVSGTRFSFADWKVSGSGAEAAPGRAWGPILWAMHTLSNTCGKDGHLLKLTAQMPPLGERDNKRVELQIRSGKAWRTAAVANIDPAARTASFRIPNWNADRDIPYRLVYMLKTGAEQAVKCVYTGTIRRDPVDRPLVIAGFTGNKDYVFPNLEIARNVGIQDPDILFFSGDQIYEDVGGYGIDRTPADRSILNYLRKWYLLGWAFGDLMRDRITISLPDDHDVYQGNIWGEGGIDPHGYDNHAKGGYAQPAKMVNVVHRTQTAHHPDPFDPTPIARGISVYYGDMVYGRVSFAILADRMFKSGPQGKVNTWEGRPDHVKSTDIDVEALDKPGLELLGERQENFLDAWTADWCGADMKVVLSQTIFCNLANYHGSEKMYLVADLDSNGWPQSGRNRALALMRKGFAFHIAGDQHLASIVHHGIDAYRDAGWSFCVPSIAAGYPRSWLPDEEGRPVKNRPEGDLPNTGDYLDGLGNHMSVYAIGNPAEKKRNESPVTMAHDKASGHGIVRFNQDEQTIGIECWRLMVDVANPKPEDQFPGWPKQIHMFENYGRAARGYLPELKFEPGENPVVQIIDEATGDIVYTLRVNKKAFRPKVFKKGSYTVKVINTAKGTVEKTKGVMSMDLQRPDE